jgi:hypothetical protein
MMGILNNPRLSENAKVAELKKAIADLPDAEKKDLYERLKDRKRMRCAATWPSWSCGGANLRRKFRVFPSKVAPS